MKYVIIIATLAVVVVLLIFFWAHVLFWSYWLIALVFAAAAFGDMASMLQAKGRGPDALAAQFAFLQLTDTSLKRWRLGILLVLDLLAGAIVWPASMASGVVLGRSMQRAKIQGFTYRREAYKALYPIIIHRSIFVLVFALALLATRWVIPELGTYRRAFLLAILVHCTIQLALTALGLSSLPTILRRSVVSPYWGFITIAFGLFTTTTLAFAGLLHWSGSLGALARGAGAVALDMLRFRKIEQVLAGNWPTPLEWYVLFAGALFYLVVVRTVLRFKEFARTDEDRIFIAGYYMALARFNDALHWLRAVKQQTLLSLRVEAIAYLGVNQLERAIAHAKKAHALRDENDILENEFELLADGAGGVPIPSRVLLRLIEAWLDHGAVDHFLLSVVSTYFGQQRLRPEDFKLILERENRHESVPLTYSFALLATDHVDQAKAGLDSTATSTPVQEMTRRSLLLLWSLGLGEPEQMGWEIDGHLRKLAQLAPDLEKDSERLVVISMLTAALGAIATQAPRFEQELRFVIEGIKGGLAEGQAQQLVPLLAERLARPDADSSSRPVDSEPPMLAPLEAAPEPEPEPPALAAFRAVADRQEETAAATADEKRFQVALSFPGEHREFVLEVADALAQKLSRRRVFYDEWYEAELLGTGGDLKLRQMYQEARLVVPFFSKHYDKPWCSLEWNAIRGILLERRIEDAVIPVHLDDTDIPGWSAVNFGIRLRNRSASEIADVICEVLALRAPKSAAAVAPRTTVPTGADSPDPGTAAEPSADAAVAATEPEESSLLVSREKLDYLEQQLEIESSPSTKDAIRAGIEDAKLALRDAGDAPSGPDSAEPDTASADDD